MSRMLEAYRVKVVTSKNVEDGATKGGILWLHSPVEDAEGYFYFVSSVDSDVGIPLAIGQVEREKEWDRYLVEKPADKGTETPVPAAVESVPVSEPPTSDIAKLAATLANAATPAFVLPQPIKGPVTEVGKPLSPNVGAVNPKDAIGMSKVDMSLVPAPATIHEAHAMMDGARKYGPYNWRENAVQARIYVAAAMRHLQQWLNGEEVAEDSGAHHLGHARACLGIILDAQEAGKLVDDRPIPLDTSALLTRLNLAIMEKNSK